MYIDLAGSHAHKGANELVTSLLGARHPLDTKMRQAEVAIFKVRAPSSDRLRLASSQTFLPQCLSLAVLTLSTNTLVLQATNAAVRRPGNKVIFWYIQVLYCVAMAMMN